MLIEIIKSVILGAVEGITEFLPISSTGHLILVNQWLSFDKSFTAMFDIVIQLGAILAVVVYFWPRLWPFVDDIAKRKEILATWQKTIVGVIPAIILGGLLGGWIEDKLFNSWVVAGALIFGGLILIYVEKKQIKPRYNSLAEIPWQIIVGIGLIQCLAMVPGTSRAAATIIGALILGASRIVAVEFSFFLAIPTMAAATGYSLLKHGLSMTGSEIVILAFGFITAFFVALAVIKFFINYIKQHNFKLFGWYRLALGILVIIYFLVI
ncbi:MAG: undecaprenyl-diphosphate phosphatase [Candidatus Paceibacterota bacterium]|jgi:undecaprenyl-diphosphatase